MSTVDVYSWDKKKVGQIELSAEVFDVPVKKELLHEVVKWQLACRRQGTHMTKTKGLVSGGGKKPFKQKGTGSARQGSSRSILMPGGGTAFGPQPRSYAYVLPKKMRKLGLRMALSHLNKESKLIVVDEMSSAKGKAKELNTKLKGFGLEKAILVDKSINESFKRASNNLEKFKYFSVEGLNVYDLLKYDMLVVTKQSVEKIIEKCAAE